MTLLFQFLSQLPVQITLFTQNIFADIVVSLEASDDFICEKAMRQPEGDSRLDEEAVLKRLSEFRTGDARDLSPLNFFDELDIHPLVVPVKEHADYGMKGSYAAVALRMGRPCRYGKLLGGPVFFTHVFHLTLMLSIHIFFHIV